MSLAKPAALMPLFTCLLMPFAAAHAGKSCVELREEIDAKLKSSGVQNYVLAILPKEEIQDGTIVGSCEGSTKKITYSRTPPLTSGETKTASAS
jgi:hypothetical protein